MAAPDTFALTSSTTVFNTTFGATSVDQLSLVLSDGTVITSGYTVDGIGDGSTSLVITWPDAVDHASKNLTVDIYPRNTMLTDFETANAVTPKAVQNEFEHLYGLALNISKASGINQAIAAGPSSLAVNIPGMTFGTSAGDVKYVLGVAYKIRSGPLAQGDVTITVHWDAVDYGISIYNSSANAGAIDWEVIYAEYPA